MGEQLKGLRVALAGPRKSEEMSRMVGNMGGSAVLRPAQGTVFLDDEALKESILSWIADPPYMTILTTGMGLDAVMDKAEEMGLEGKLLQTLAGSRIAARGYKTVNALKKRGLSPEWRDDDGSTAGLIRGLGPVELEGKKVVLQLHGDPALRLTAWLDEAGALTRLVLPYRHTPPEPGSLELLLDDILNGRVDAVAFTSAPQARFLLEHAEAAGQSGALLHAFAGPVLAVSVGRITAEPLKDAGVERIVMPEQERMGSMFIELGRFVTANGGK